nr:DUF2071 domain-containing protein [Marinococcus halophilus]
MKWRNALFAHWEKTPGEVARSLPEHMEVDTFQGRAYVGVVSFSMHDIRPSFFPKQTGLHFPELNLRTYVCVDGEPGIYFYNLDASSPLGVWIARRNFAIPYYQARFSIRHYQSWTYWNHHRRSGNVRFRAKYRTTGEQLPAAEGSLENWLAERYRFYTAKDRQIWYGDVVHKPWKLYRGEYAEEENGLLAAGGFNHSDGRPVHVMVSPGVDVGAVRLRKK